MDRVRFVAGQLLSDGTRNASLFEPPHGCSAEVMNISTRDALRPPGDCCVHSCITDLGCSSVFQPLYIGSVLTRDYLKIRLIVAARRTADFASCSWMTGRADLQ